MNFFATFKCDVESAGYLIRSFFEEFNPESSICIKGDEGKVEICFEKPPTKIIEAITNHCEILEFQYGKQLNELAKKELGQVAVARVQNSKGTIYKGELVELDEFATKASSYEEFVKLISDWLEMKSHKEFFKNLLVIAEFVDSIKWVNIEEMFRSKNVPYTQWDRNYLSKQVSKKFLEKGKNVTATRLIEAMLNYKTYDFSNSAKNASEDLKEEEPNEEILKSGKSNLPENPVTAITTNVSEKPIKKKNTLECMSGIAEIEKVVEDLDKIPTIEEKVRAILTVMRDEKTTIEEWKLVFRISIAAVKMDDLDSGSIFSKVNITEKSEMMEAQMTFSKFINSFIRKHEVGKMVKMREFLKDLKNVVIGN